MTDQTIMDKIGEIKEAKNSLKIELNKKGLEISDTEKLESYPVKVKKLSNVSQSSDTKIVTISLGENN